MIARVINAAADLHSMTQQPNFDPSSPEFQEAVNIANSYLNEPVEEEGEEEGEDEAMQPIGLDDPQYLEAASIYMGLKH